MMKGAAHWMLFAAIVVSGLVVSETASAEDSAVPKSKLVSYLDDYGDWMTSSEHGPVWQPDREVAEGEWHPFSNGQWLYTDRGWYWESRDNFGWLTCHYGRWKFIHEGDVGWIWVAGEEWASAWVAWRESEDMVGWGALPPGARGMEGGSPWEMAVPDWQAFLFVPHQRLMASDVRRYVTGGSAVARAVIEDARLVTMPELAGERWSVFGPGLTKLQVSEGALQVEFVERYPSDAEAEKPFVGGEKIVAYAPPLDLKKALAWVPGNIASLDAKLLEAERIRLASQRKVERSENSVSRVIPRQPVYRVPEKNVEPEESIVVQEVMREPVIIYEQVVNSPWYYGRPCPPNNCHCSKCRPELRPERPVERYPGNNAQREQLINQRTVQREQLQRQRSAQEAQRERQRAAQERARRGRNPNSPRVPLGPGL